MNKRALPTTIAEAIAEYLEVKSVSRRASVRTYRSALMKFQESLLDNDIDPATAPPHCLNRETMIYLIEACADLAPSTEHLYVDVTRDFFSYVAAEDIAPVNLAKIQQAIRSRVRRAGRRLPDFPEDDIERLIAGVEALKRSPSEDPRERLVSLRDRALILTLADTGLRIHEACGLVRGSLDRSRRRAIVIGKGDKQAVVHFSERAIAAIDDYLSARRSIDGATGRPLAGLALFARHDKGAGEKKIKAITTRTGQNIVEQRVEEILGQEATGTITPHSLRHFFVTKVVKRTGNIYTAKRLARHENISTTERYSHLADQELASSYHEVFDGEDPQ